MCVYDKHHCIPFPLNGHSRAKEILELVHTYVCDPMAITSHGREIFFKLLLMMFLKKCFFNTMKTKFGVFDKLKVFKALVEN
jgi:hypothetical protein